MTQVHEGTNGTGKTLKERFFAFVERPDGEAGCWTWKGCADRNGIPLFLIADGPRGRQAASRVHFQILNGPLMPWQALQPTCALGKRCANGAHHVLMKAPRKRPATVRRFARARREELLAFVDRMGVAEAERTFGIEARTLTRWLRERRKQLNGAGDRHDDQHHPAPGAAAVEGDEAR